MLTVSPAIPMPVKNRLQRDRKIEPGNGIRTRTMVRSATLFKLDETACAASAVRCRALRLRRFWRRNDVVYSTMPASSAFSSSASRRNTGSNAGVAICAMNSVLALAM